MRIVREWTGHSIETMKKFYLQVTDGHREAALQVKPQLPPAASKDSGCQLAGEAKPNPKPLMPDMPRHPAQQKSQTPIITAFGFECPGLSGPSVAAEGLELRLQTAQKRTPVFKGEAKPEAVNVWSVGCWRERLQEDAQKRINMKRNLRNPHPSKSASRDRIAKAVRTQVQEFVFHLPWHGVYRSHGAPTVGRVLWRCQDDSPETARYEPCGVSRSKTGHAQ